MLKWYEQECEKEQNIKAGLIDAVFAADRQTQLGIDIREPFADGDHLNGRHARPLPFRIII